MTGVNELVYAWTTQEEEPSVEIGRHSYTASECADDLDEVARTAWHPVSGPPTEADGDQDGLVAVYRRSSKSDLNRLMVVPVSVAQDEQWGHPQSEWARIRDVVLLPQSTGDEA